MLPESIDVVDLLASVDGVHKVELLVEFGDRLSPLPHEYEPLRDAGLYAIAECQAPVFFYVDVSGGSVVIRADVPIEAPVARGFAGMLYAAFDGEPAARVLIAPEDILSSTGLDTVLSLRRRRGLSAIYNALRSVVAANA